jgi:hypothetical protein
MNTSRAIVFNAIIVKSMFLALARNALASIGTHLAPLPNDATKR